MIILRTPAELAATVRAVAATLPSHRHAEASDLRQAAGVLDALSAPAASSAPRHASGLIQCDDYAEAVADFWRFMADAKDRP